MKKLLPLFILLLFVAYLQSVIQSCNQKEHKQLQFDDQGIILIDSVTIAPHDTYYQGRHKPTRGTSATVEINNNNDTAKTFIIKLIEVK